MPLEIKEVRIRANLEKRNEAGGNIPPASADSGSSSADHVPIEAVVEKVVDRLLAEHLDRIKDALDQLER